MKKTIAIAFTTLSLNIIFGSVGLTEPKSKPPGAIWNTVWQYPDGSIGEVDTVFYAAPRDGKLAEYPDFHNGRLIGRFTQEPRGNQKFEGYWVQDSGSAQTCANTKDGSNHYGKAEFTINPEQTDQFTGKWSYCDEKPAYDWNGTLDSY